MSNMELELKIQNINQEELASKIIKLGGQYISSSEQFLSVYDLPYINQRYNSSLYELNNEKIELRKEIALNKIKKLFEEIDQLINTEERSYLKRYFDIEKLSEIFNLNTDEIIKILNSSEMIDLVNNYKATPKKWIRLRKTIEKTQDKKIESVTLTVKHILKANETNIQQMQETEIRVDSFEETNELLEKIGFFHRSYQEKKREKYILNEHEIDIDTWPGIPTYFEVEGKDKKDLEEILNTLGYSFDDAISCTVDEIYRKIGMDINNMSELKFEDN
jgi:adenylate cyclase class 2